TEMADHVHRGLFEDQAAHHLGMLDRQSEGAETASAPPDDRCRNRVQGPEQPRRVVGVFSLVPGGPPAGSVEAAALVGNDPMRLRELLGEMSPYQDRARGSGHQEDRGAVTTLLDVEIEIVDANEVPCLHRAMASASRPQRLQPLPVLLCVDLSPSKAL